MAKHRIFISKITLPYLIKNFISAYGNIPYYSLLSSLV